MQGPLPARSPGKAAAALLLGCALSACAVLPRSGEAPAPKPPAAYATSQSFAAPAADWPKLDWWRAYGDAGLDQLIDEALRNAPSMAEARARIDKARADLGTARAGLFLSLIHI